jgi:ABC-type hemin transport system substrate-binding protein
VRCPLRTIAIVLGLGALAAPASCARQPSPKPTAGPRIVSLSPAITRTIEALGAGADIVGCTPWCGLEGVAVVGSLEDRNAEAILALRPALVVRQGDQPDPVLDAAIAAGGGRCLGWRLNSVADVERLVGELGRALDDAGTPDCGLGAARVIAAHRRAVSTGVRTAPPVLFLFATDPPAAFGSGTYLDDLWRSMGGANAVTQPGYPALTAEDVLRMRPRAIAVVAGRVPGELPPWLARLPGVHVVVAPELLEPSARMLVEGPEALRRLDEAIASEAAP